MRATVGRQWCTWQHFATGNGLHGTEPAGGPKDAKLSESPARLLKVAAAK
jgi:hypothetical protein